MRNRFFKLTSAVAASVCCYSFASSPIASQAKVKLCKPSGIISTSFIQNVALGTITGMSIAGLGLSIQKIINDKNNNNSNCINNNQGFYN